jgi:hypothetical protein
MAKSKRRKQMTATSGASKPPPWEDAIVTGMKRAVRKVERRTGAGDIGGTGQTVLKASRRCRAWCAISGLVTRRSRRPPKS